MIQVRLNTFETNSSSTHSICIPTGTTNTNYPSKIWFSLGEFGWECDEADPASYLYTSILCSGKSNEYIKKLNAFLKKNDIEAMYEVSGPPDEDGFYSSCYIDHSDELYDFLEAIFNDDNLLSNYLFSSNTCVYTGNDNCECEDQYSKCCLACDKQWDNKLGSMCNTHQDTSKFKYFFKGN